MISFVAINDLSLTIAQKGLILEAALVIPVKQQSTENYLIVSARHGPKKEFYFLTQVLKSTGHIVT